MATDKIKVAVRVRPFNRRGESRDSPTDSCQHFDSCHPSRSTVNISLFTKHPHCCQLQLSTIVILFLLCCLFFLFAVCFDSLFLFFAKHHWQWWQIRSCIRTSMTVNNQVILIVCFVLVFVFFCLLAFCSRFWQECSGTGTATGAGLSRISRAQCARMRTIAALRIFHQLIVVFLVSSPLPPPYLPLKQPKLSVVNWTKMSIKIWPPYDVSKRPKWTNQHHRFQRHLCLFILFVTLFFISLCLQFDVWCFLAYDFCLFMVYVIYCFGFTFHLFIELLIFRTFGCAFFVWPRVPIVTWLWKRRAIAEKTELWFDGSKTIMPTCLNR